MSTSITFFELLSVVFSKIAQKPAKKVASAGHEDLKVSFIPSRNISEFPNIIHKLVVGSDYSESRGCWSIPHEGQLLPA
ncbi:MAG TPA: hypothetical protein VNA15_00350 [Candidatus Angelobacter sp.]|nr:hypothetical protein [Candidatus Angelobacter sp.]